VNGYKPIYVREEEGRRLYRFSIGRRSFLFYKNRTFFYDSTRRSPLGEMTLAGFMRIVKSGRFAIKATVLRFILNFIMQMTGRG
jgi:hypothetical protein